MSERPIFQKHMIENTILIFHRPCCILYCIQCCLVPIWSLATMPWLYRFQELSFLLLNKKYPMNNVITTDLTTIYQSSL